MHVVQGNIWDELGKAKLILVTGNAYVTQEGKLVMGRGAALEMRDKFPGIDAELGRLIKGAGWEYPSPTPYNCVVTTTFHPKTHLGVFQVKWHWKDQADTTLIRRSAKGLNNWAERNPGRIVLNFPGIGNGRLAREEVLPILEEELRSNDIYVYELGQS